VIGGVLVLQEQVTALVVLGAAVTLVAIAFVRKNDQQRRRY
jgi:drug/metabolite transporter (DMT)-like permease